MRLLAASLVAVALGCTSEQPAPLTAPPRPPPVLGPTASLSGPPSAGAPAPPATILTSHPRIWITSADLPRLRGWASAANPLWAQGLERALQAAVTTYDTDFFPGGQPNPSWPDPGTENWVSKCTEAYAEMFAFASLVHPDPAARAAHATRAKRLLMHVIDEAAKGDADAPFRGATFPTYNRASYWGEAFGLTVDWIYPSLDASEKARIRAVLHRWAQANLHAATSNDEHPQPVGVLRDSRLLADPQRLRWTANNYYTAHMRALALTGLAFDEADDPPLDPAKAPGDIGNTLRSWLDDAIGAWLYQQYAVYEDPQVAAAALGVPAKGLGPASGGLPAEGFLYGASLGMLHEALLGLETAGYTDRARLGPQVGLAESSYWDRFLDGFLSSITPDPGAPATGYPGPVYPLFGYGDTLRAWVTEDQAATFASIALHAARVGNATRLEKARWVLVNAMPGGAAHLPDRLASPWGNSEATLAILQFLALDPEAPPPVDPRPALPRVFHDRALGRVIARSSWSSRATVFAYKCGWLTIGHQLGDCNQIELFRKGEWLVKERSGYANDLAAMTPENHDTLSVQSTAPNARPSGLQWFEEATWSRGGQWTLGMSAGDPEVRVSYGAGWVFAYGDATNLYNRAPADEVTQATRAVAWLAPDRVIVLDRAATRATGRFKRFNLTFVGEPVITGRRVTVTTPSGQVLRVTSLLPDVATLASSPAESWNRVAEGEPTRWRLTVEAPGGPSEVRFLHVLEATDAGAAGSSVQLVRSSSGAPLDHAHPRVGVDGASVGSATVTFVAQPPGPGEEARFVVPGETTGQLIAGLAPGACYAVALRPQGGAIEVALSLASVGSVGASTADAAGVLALGALAGGGPP